jgi:hypothetical protein
LCTLRDELSPRPQGSANATICPTPNVDPSRGALAAARAGNAALAQTTLDKIKSGGGSTSAYREASIPFSDLDDKAQPMDKELAERLKTLSDKPPL